MKRLSTSSTSVELLDVDLVQSQESVNIVDNTSTTQDNPVIVVETGMDMTSVRFLLLVSTSK